MNSADSWVFAATFVVSLTYAVYRVVKRLEGRPRVASPTGRYVGARTGLAAAQRTRNHAHPMTRTEKRMARRRSA